MTRVTARVTASLFATAATTLTLAPSSTAHAQRVAVAPVSSNTPSALTRAVTVTLDNVTVETAVNAIATNGGVRIQYRLRLLDDVRTHITLHLSKTTVGQALDRALAGTGLTAVAISDDLVTLKAVVVANGGIVTGTVTDAKTNKPLSGASVALDDATKGVMTAADGTFRLPNVAAGSHRITVKMIGHAKQVRAVTVVDDQTTTVNVALEERATELDNLVVTGTVIPTERKAVPSAMTVITAKEIEQRGITQIQQLFRGDVPGLFSQNTGASNPLDTVAMFSRGATKLEQSSYNPDVSSNAIKTYVDGVELANSAYLSQIDPRSIERIEILTGPQASTIYGSNAINGVMQIFTKRGTTARPQITAEVINGLVQNNFSPAYAPQHTADGRISGIEGRLSYQAGGSWDYTGAWAPAKQSARTGIYGGARMQFGTLTLDGSERYTMTTNRERGVPYQLMTQVSQSGVGPYLSALTPDRNTSLSGTTTGLTATYAPFSWWSYTATVGLDGSRLATMDRSASYETRSDSSLYLNQTLSDRASQGFNSTLQLPVTEMSRLSVTAGIDHWRTTGSYTSAHSQDGTFNGQLASPYMTRSHPDHNTGAFLQSQLGLADALFFTYGIRAEWNPNYGEEAQPNIAPRYGMAYTHDIGGITAKLRASYGKSTRPPTQGERQSYRYLWDTESIAGWGPHDDQLANPELGPESQRGFEGGLELYVGTRGSLNVTRYDQTVDDLITSVYGVDSLKSIITNPRGWCIYGPQYCGYMYLGQTQYLNIGSVRNQGWELQGTTTLGPVNVKGTYSWTTSRVIGVNQKWESKLYGDQFKPGYMYKYVPEHTWGLVFTYATQATMLTANVNGIGMMLFGSAQDMTFYNNNYLFRINTDKHRIDWPITYRGVTPGYATVDVNVAQRLTHAVDALVQIQNATNYYHNDLDAYYATIGRQSKLGLRVRL